MQLRGMVIGASIVFLLSAVGCVDDEDPGNNQNNGTTDVGADADAGGDAGADAGGDVADTDDDLSYPLTQCDPIDPNSCSLPWPSNLYLEPDNERATGYQLTFGEESLPKSNQNAHLDPDRVAQLDGYGLGVPIMTIIPNVDPEQLPGRFDIEGSMASDAPIVLLEVGDDGSSRRIPYWAELDVRAQDQPASQVMFVRPGEVLESDTRYVVAFRNLNDRSGDPIEASEAFASLRDGTTDDGSALARRQARFDEVFGFLEDAGVSRDELILAWDFHTASTDALHEQLLTVRDKGLEAVGDEGPTLEVDEIKEFAKTDDGSGLEVHEHIKFEVSGTFEAPHYMRSVTQGYRFNLDENGEIQQNGTRTVDWLMRIPHTAVDGPPQGVMTYGHGMFGARQEILADHIGLIAHDYNYIVVAVDMVGMSAEDVQTALVAVVNPSRFSRIADRLHQGLLEHVLLTRAANRQLADLDVIVDNNITIDDKEPFYFGGSQGGIFGQPLMAIDPDLRKGFLAVPGVNYATMLQRSKNFDDFQDQLANIFPDPADLAIVIGYMQLMWDRTDPVSYVRHLEEQPLDGNPRHVLMAVSKGDKQVPVVTVENVARSDVGIPAIEPYDEDRSIYGAETATYPHEGSGIVLFDFGNPWPDEANSPPDDGMDDPHDDLAGVDAAGNLLDTFLQEGRIIDICGGSYCQFTE
jgi:hypothetical protein